jgi:hypothetical protein
MMYDMKRRSDGIVMARQLSTFTGSAIIRERERERTREIVLEEVRKECDINASSY